MIRQEDSLQYHADERPGKVELRATKACVTPREMRLAYYPGAAFPCRAIARDPRDAYRYTARGNLVGSVTNGSAVPGLGNIGPVAAKPMQEGIAVVFKRLADIDVFDLELDIDDPDRFVDAIQMLEPTFGGINLKDIRAPEGLHIYDRLSKCMNIPVFHENLYSTAVVAVAAMLNALDLVEKSIEEIRVVVCGAGTVGTGCIRLLTRLGVRPENLLVYDVKGLIHTGREDIHDYQREYARDHPATRLEDGLKGADVFLGASAGGVMRQEMIRSMERFPLVFALATPDPEISYELARASRRDVIVATSLPQFPNAVIDLLSFPYIFRGALDVQATRITEGMLVAAARALAELAREEVIEEVEKAYGEHFSFGPEYLLPKGTDPRILVRESSAVARCAIEEGVARRPMEIEVYQESLATRLGTGRETLRGLILRARQTHHRVVFSEGASETILRASRILVDEDIARPILVGSEEEIRQTMDRLDLDLGGVPVVDPVRSPRFESYVQEYFRMRGRQGVTLAAAAQKMRQPDVFAAMMLQSGDADMMVAAGVSTHYAESVRTIMEVIGTSCGSRHISSHHLVLLGKEVVFLADCAVNIDPSAEDLAEAALSAASMAKALGIEPRVAMLSFSNFGSVDHSFTRKVRRATEIAKERAPGLIIDGEMQLAVALDGSLRQAYFPFSDLKKDANVLIVPDLQSGNLALHLLQHVGEAVAIGPVLMGTRLPVHVVQYGASVEGVVNLTAIAVVEAAAVAHTE